MAPRLYLILATRGEAGIPGTDRSRAGAIREAEGHSTCAVLGVRGLDFLDYLDGQLAQIDVESAVDRLAGRLRCCRRRWCSPSAPTGRMSRHSDHIAVGRWTTMAYHRLCIEPGGLRMLSYLAPSAAMQQVCGEATCMAFAFGLLESRHRPEECPPLASSTSVAQCQALAEMLAGVAETADRSDLNAL